ncbi:hypothetical protein ACWEFL_13135 [Streptomyces sp. NPDC004838]
MTSQTGGSPAQGAPLDRLRELLYGPDRLGGDALLAALDAEFAAEFTARETRAYAAGWNDAVTASRSGRPLPQSRPGAS